MTRGLDQDLGSPGGGELEVVEGDHVGVESGGQQGEVVEHALVNRVSELRAWVQEVMSNHNSKHNNIPDL